jgi:mRNA interferase HigB
MRVIAQSTMRKFWECPEYADSQSQLEAWYREAKQAQWSDPREIEAQYRTASILKRCIVFNIARDKYRLAVEINYPTQTVFIKFIGTHKQYAQVGAEIV